MAARQSGVASLARFLIRRYQRVLSPIFVAFGAQCRFSPSCSQYAHDAFSQLPVGRAFGLTLWRLCRCAPWSQGGADPILPQRGHATSFVSFAPVAKGQRLL